MQGVIIYVEILRAFHTCKNLDCANLSYETWMQSVSHDSSLIRFVYQNQSSIICVLRTYITISDVCHYGISQHRFQGKTLAHSSSSKPATFRKLIEKYEYSHNLALFTLRHILHFTLLGDSAFKPLTSQTRPLTFLACF